MPETVQITGGVTPSTSYPGGWGNAQLEAAIVRPYGSATRTVRNIGNQSCEWCIVLNDGSTSGFTTMAANTTTTVTPTTPKFFRPSGSAGPTTLYIDLP